MGGPLIRGTIDALPLWHSGSVMDCHTTARGSIPIWNGVFTELL